MAHKSVRFGTLSVICSRRVGEEMSTSNKLSTFLSPGLGPMMSNFTDRVKNLSSGSPVLSNIAPLNAAPGLVHAITAAQAFKNTQQAAFGRNELKKSPQMAFVPKPAPTPM